MTRAALITEKKKEQGALPKGSSKASHPPLTEPPKGPRTKHHEKVEVIVRKKLFGEAPKEKHFIVSDGRKLKNVKELIECLETMGDDIFSYHVNEAKNDFSSWLHDVFSFEHMAKEIKNAKHRLETQRLIMRNLIKEIEKLESQSKKTV